MRLFIGISLALHSVVLITGGGQLMGTPFTGTPVSVILRPVTGTSSLTDSSAQDSTPIAHNSPAHSVPVPSTRIRSHKINHSTRALKKVKGADTLSAVSASPSGNDLNRRNTIKTDATPPSSTGDLLTSELQAMLAANFSYPSIARRNNWEGNVLASVRVEEDGSLSRITLVKTSGYNVLDNATLKGLQDIHVLPAARDWLQGQHFDIVLPVKYRLVNK